MTLPLIVLALARLIQRRPHPCVAVVARLSQREPAHFDIRRLVQPMLFVSLVLVAAGIGLGIVMYRRAGAQDRNRPGRPTARVPQPALFRFLENRMWLDELYDRTVIAFAGLRARFPIGWTATSGTAWCAPRRCRAAFWNLHSELRRTRYKCRSRRKYVGTRGLGRVVSAAFRPNANLSRRSRDRHARAAPSSTHGWHDHSADSLPLARGAFRRHRAAEPCAWNRLGFNVLTAIMALMLWRNFDTSAAGLQIGGTSGLDSSHRG